MLINPTIKYDIPEGFQRNKPYEIKSHNWLVVSTPLKNMKVKCGYYSLYMEK